MDGARRSRRRGCKLGAAVEGGQGMLLISLDELGRKPTARAGQVLGTYSVDSPLARPLVHIISKYLGLGTDTDTVADFLDAHVFKMGLIHLHQVFTIDVVDWGLSVVVSIWESSYDIRLKSSTYWAQLMRFSHSPTLSSSQFLDMSAGSCLGRGAWGMRLT